MQFFPARIACNSCSVLQELQAFQKWCLQKLHMVTTTKILACNYFRRSVVDGPKIIACKNCTCNHSFRLVVEFRRWKCQHSISKEHLSRLFYCDSQSRYRLIRSLMILCHVYIICCLKLSQLFVFKWCLVIFQINLQVFESIIVITICNDGVVYCDWRQIV